MATPLTAYYVEPITLRFTETRVTSDQQGVGQLLAGRYRVIRGPLGHRSGEAELYQCQDELRQTTVAFKFYHAHKHPKRAVLEQLHGVIHPYLLGILDHGEWQGRFFEVMPYCGGGSLSERLPLDEPALRNLLPPLLEVMRFCHDHGIIHRDIKPSNLLFNDHDDLQLADFGISSYLETDGGITRTAGNLTLDYAAPELIEGHQIGPPTDYYALGITLLHALLGRSPFAGLSQNDLIIAHLRGRRPIPDHLSPAFRQLIQGLTLNHMEHRWGYAEVQDWLAGHEVAVIPDQFTDTRGQRLPSYPGWPAAHTPEQLALDLSRFDAIHHLLRGDIRRWLFDHFGHALADRADEISQAHSKRPAVALHYLRFALAPKSPLVIAGREIAHLEDLIGILEDSFQDPKLEEALLQALAEEQIRAWLLAAKPAGEHSEKLVALMDALQKRQASHQSTIPFALCYLLDPTRPLRLTPQVSIQQPHEIGSALVRDAKAVFRAWWFLFKSHRLDEWLRAINWQPLDETLAFLQEVRYLFLEYPNSQNHAVLCRFAPDLPFFLDGKGINHPEELAQAVDHQPDLKGKFIHTLENGQLLAWLMGSGRLEDTAPLRQYLMNADLSWSVRAEQVLQLLSPQRQGPVLATDQCLLNLGVVSADKLLPTATLALRNSGGGYLFGNIGWGDQLTGIEVSRYQFENPPCSITLTLKIPDWEPGTHSHQLQIHSNGGTLNIPVTYFVPASKLNPTWPQRIAHWLAPLGKIQQIPAWLFSIGKKHPRVIFGVALSLWGLSLLNDYLDQRRFHKRFERLSATQVPVNFDAELEECFIDHKQRLLWRVLPGAYSIEQLPDAIKQANSIAICQRQDWIQATDLELRRLAEGLVLPDGLKLVANSYYWGEESSKTGFYIHGDGQWEQFRTYETTKLRLFLTTNL
ncbi:putative non-specific serine/threonine protein kinase [Gammaproteobacteria bacterium]